MTSANRGLGRGLDALLGGVRADEKVSSDSAEVRMISIDAISPNPHQPRRAFSEDALNDLAAFNMCLNDLIQVSFYKHTINCF